jgi:hypothetical protein
MKPTHLFFILFTSTLAVALMAGQPSGDVEKYDPRPFKDFVSRWRDSTLSERASEYRAKLDTLKSEPLKGALNKEGYFFDLISETAKQGDFESLELLEKDISPHWKSEFWMAVELYGNIDSAEKLHGRCFFWQVLLIMLDNAATSEYSWTSTASSAIKHV